MTAFCAIIFLKVGVGRTMTRVTKMTTGGLAKAVDNNETAIPYDGMELLLSDLTESQVLQVKKAFRERVISAGTIVIKQGDFQDFLYVVREGRARISKKTAKGESTVDIIGPGEDIGFSSLFQEKSGVNCIAVDSLSVIYCTRDTLVYLMLAIPQLSLNVARILEGGLCLSKKESDRLTAALSPSDYCTP
jgi:CRP-like cAMP-binding protein